jgi:hypothetical protein
MEIDMHFAHRTHGTTACAVVACLVALVTACGGDDDDETRADDASSAAETTVADDVTSSAASGGGDCALIDVGTVEELFAIDVSSVDEPVPGNCFFAPNPDPETPNVGVTVLRNDLGAVLYEEFAAEIEGVGVGSGGSGLSEPAVGDEAIAAPGPDAIDLAARSGDVNVRITAVVPSDSPLSQDDLLANATELAQRVL